MNKFYAAYPVWCDDDGGWHEGAAYWAGYMGKIVWWLQAAQSALQIDGLKKPFFAQVGDFPLYVAPPGSPNMGFGDLVLPHPLRGRGRRSWNTSSAPSASRPGSSHAGYWRWWTEQWQMNRAAGIAGFLYQANLPDLPEARPPTDLPPSKVFRGIGVASLHTTLTNSAEDVHLLFKSSPFGSQSHGHNPQNSFQLNAYGEALLTTCVYRDYYGSKFHYQWCHSTRAHNAVLVDGQGQRSHSASSTGSILDFELVARYGLRRRQRRRGLRRPARAVSAMRRLRQARPHRDLRRPGGHERGDLPVHAARAGAFVVDEAAARARIEQPKAGATVQYLSPVPLSFRQWDGYEPKPEREFPNQWHLEAGSGSGAGKSRC